MSSGVGDCWDNARGEYAMIEGSLGDAFGDDVDTPVALSTLGLDVANVFAPKREARPRRAPPH
jgi:hypothetical protein